MPAEGLAVIVKSPGFPIGLAEEAYCERSIQLHPGDRLYLYSDGLTDAMNGGGVPFGEPQLLTVVTQERNAPIGEGIATLLEKIAMWHGNDRSQDDISILAIEFAKV